MSLLRLIGEASLTDLLALLGATALACLFARRRRLRYVGWLVLYLVVDAVIALLPIGLHWNFGRWNWIGQGASLLFSFWVARAFFTAEEIGLRLPRSRREWVWTGIGVVGALAVAIGPAFVGSGSRPDAETFAYQATLPGLVEELSFRGVGLALLLRAFSAGEGDRRAEWIAVLVSAVWFTAGHVFHLEHGRFQMAWTRVLDVLPMAVWYAVVRLRSRSLLGGVLAHNAANTLVEGIAFVRF